MAKEIDVLFIEEKKGHFQLGQQKKVKLGYARNYLLPAGFALLLTPENATKINAIKKKANKRQEDIKKQAQSIQKELNGKSVTFTVKTSDGSQLYGSISFAELLSKINKENKTELDKYDIKGYVPIKETGSYDLPISIHKDVEIKMTVTVEAEPEKDKKRVTKKAVKKEETAEEKVQEKVEDKVVETSETEDVVV